MLDPGLVDPPTPTPAPWAAGPDVVDSQTPASTPSAVAIGQLDGHNAANITQPRSLIWSGVLGLTVAVAGLLMIGWRRRQW